MTCRKHVMFVTLVFVLPITLTLYCRFSTFRKLSHVHCLIQTKMAGEKPLLDRPNSLTLVRPKEVVSAQVKLDHGLVHVQCKSIILKSSDLCTNDRKLRQATWKKGKPTQANCYQDFSVVFWVNERRRGMTGQENNGTWKYRHCGRQANYKTSSFERAEVRRTTNQSNVKYRDTQPMNLVTIWCRCVTYIILSNWTKWTHMWTLVPTYRYQTALRINWLQKSIKSFQVPRNSSSHWVTIIVLAALTLRPKTSSCFLWAAW